MEFPHRSFAFLCAPWLHRVLLSKFLSTRIESKLLHDFNFEILQGERFVRHQGESWNWAEEMWSRDKMSLLSAGRQYRIKRENEKKTFEFWLNFPSFYLRVSTMMMNSFLVIHEKKNFSSRKKMNFPSTDDALSSSSQRCRGRHRAETRSHQHVRAFICMCGLEYEEVGRNSILKESTRKFSYFSGSSSAAMTNEQHRNNFEQSRKIEYD